MFLNVARFVCVFCFVVYVRAVFVDKLRNKEEPLSNVVKTSRFLYPLDDQQPCKTDLGYLGQCVDVRFCYAARRAVLAGNHPIRCGWIDNFIPMVCCHPDQVQHPKLVLAHHKWRH